MQEGPMCGITVKPLMVTATKNRVFRVEMGGI